MKRLSLLTAVLVLLCAALTAHANVFLNSTDYGLNFLGAVTAARSGDVVEFRDNGSYSIAGQNRLNYGGITVRSAEGYRATILATDGGTNGTFQVNAGNITFQNLSIKGTVYMPGSGTYIFQCADKDADLNYTAKGLTVRDVDFTNVRGVLDAGDSGWVTDLTFVNNTVTNTNYGLGKNGMYYGGGVVITGNTFTNNGVGTGSNAQAALWIQNNRGSLLIDGNTFTNYDGRYAIFSDGDLSANPITFGTNDFGNGSGKSTSPVNLYALTGGGYAVGLMNAASSAPVPEPASILALAMGLCSIAGFRKFRK